MWMIHESQCILEREYAYTSSRDAPSRNMFTGLILYFDNSQAAWHFWPNRSGFWHFTPAAFTLFLMRERIVLAGLAKEPACGRGLCNHGIFRAEHLRLFEDFGMAERPCHLIGWSCRPKEGKILDQQASA
ncbi:hypothetical protein MCOR25_007690 [Pyricularia grisea]|nr:hypothetical protein MCOR25_007690 [Pyricularia grisea]